MMAWLAGAVLAALALAAILLRHARAYTDQVERIWPATGRFIDAGGERIHITETGPPTAPRLLLIHGASANLRELWGALAATLGAEHCVVAYDRPGYGHSSRTMRGAEKLSLQARVAADALRASGEGPAIIVAHSFGAAVALRLALDAPALVAGLVLIGPASHPYPGPNAWWARLATAPLIGNLFCAFVIPWMGPIAGRAGIANNFAPSSAPAGYYDDAGVGLIFRPAAFRASARDVCASNAEFSAQAPRYPEIFAPAVIVTGDVDKVVSPKRHARALARDLPAAELVIAPNAGHMPHRLRPDLVFAAIARVNSMASAHPQS